MNENTARWAEAVIVLKQHGAAAPLFIAARIGALAAEGCAEGVTRWQVIAVRVAELMGMTADAPTHPH